MTNLHIYVSQVHDDRYAELQVIIDDSYTIDFGYVIDGDELMKIVNDLQEDIDHMRSIAETAQANAY